jgi:predicted nucleotidyltransferase
MVTVSAPSAGPLGGLAQLRELAAGGRLDALCERYGIAVLTVFGSTARGDATPRDLDIAVLHRPGYIVDYPALIGDLQQAAGTDIDLAVLDRAGPVLRERALVGSLPLYEYRPGEWVRAATAAVLERMDTAWMRRLDLDLLAG